MSVTEAKTQPTQSRSPSVFPFVLAGVLYLTGFWHQRPSAHARSPKSPDESVSSTERPAQLAPVRSRPASWTDVAKHVWVNIGRHRVMAIAAGVTFYGLLAIFPAIATIVSLYGLFADTGTLRDQLNTLSGAIPGGAIDVVGDQISLISQHGHSSLGFALIVGLLLSLWSSNSGMKAIFDALNVVYNVEERRGFIKLNAVSLIFTLSAIVFMLLAIASVILVPIVLKLLPLGTVAELLLGYARWPLVLVGVGLALSFIYRFGPDRDNAQWRWITWGSAFAAVIWIAASLLFSWYTANFGSYNKTYGSLGAVIGFMTWMWISTIVILIGAEIDAVLERWDRGSAH
jgi:membrane protein